MIETEGREALRAKEPNQSAVAKAIGVDQSTVSGWFHGAFRPEPPNRTKIRIVYGVAEELWLTDAERAEVAAFRETAKPKRRRSRKAA